MSLNELADILDVSRQQVSAWENGVKTISQKRLRQLSEYFGVDEKFFLDISEDDKEFIVSKALYRRQDNEKEVYCSVKQGEMADDFKYRPFSYPDFEESLDEHMIRAKRKKKDTIEGIQEAMGYFGKPNKIIEEISAINRGCKVYDALTKYLRQMPNEDPGSTCNMTGNVIFAFNCKWSQPTRSLNGRGSLLVCPGNSKSVSLRGSLYPVTKYWEKRSFFPRRKEIIALCRQACKLGRYKSGTG